MNEELTEEYKKYEEMSLRFCEAEDYQSALCCAERWKDIAARRFGHESSEMARCLQQLGQIHYAMRQPEKEYEAEYGQPNSLILFCEYLMKLASPFYWLHQNLQRPMDFYQEGYEIMKKTKGVYAPETSRYKCLYVEFVCEKTLAAHFAESLWMLITIVPLLFILTPVMAGLSWHSLGVALLMTGMLVVWRIIGATFFFFMTKRHYERTIQ